MLESEEEKEYVKFGRTQFDYKQILLIHLRNMSNLITQKIFPNFQEPYTPKEMIELADDAINNSFEWGVDYFDGLLAPYSKKDKQFQSNMKDLEDESKKTKMLVKIYNKKKFHFLMELMDRLNLLLEGETSEDI